MKNIILFGVNQFSELLNFYLKDNVEYDVCAFTVDEKFCTKSTFCEKPVIPFEKITEVYCPDDYYILICIGYSQMNDLRERKFIEAKEKGYKIMSYIHPSAIITGSSFGEGNIIMEGAIIGAFCKIGDGNVFWPKAHIAHHTEIGNFNFFTISVAVAGNVKINNNCFFGNNCTIKNDIEVYDYTLVGASAYLSHSTENVGEVYVPAKSIKLADKKSREINLTKKRV